MGKNSARKMKPEPPYWWLLDSDNCWWCKNRKGCNGCKYLKEAIAMQRKKI